MSLVALERRQQGPIIFTFVARVISARLVHQCAQSRREIPKSRPHVLQRKISSLGRSKGMHFLRRLSVDDPAVGTLVLCRAELRLVRLKPAICVELAFVLSFKLPQLRLEFGNFRGCVS
jgi:hypothetical protein